MQTIPEGEVAPGPSNYPTTTGQPGVPLNIVHVIQQPQVVKPKRRSLIARSLTSVPILPLWVALVLCAINALLPGIGTMLASLLLFCIGDKSDSWQKKIASFWTVFVIGLMQLCFIPICYFGLYWSVIWGIKLVSKASRPEGLKMENFPQSTIRLPGDDKVSNQPNQQVVQTTTSIMYQEFYACIPILPLWCAVILCVCNCIVPGFGTLVASFSLFYCGTTNHPSASKLQAFLVLFISAWLQLVSFLTVGYIWSVVWGYAFVTKAVLYAQGQQVITTTTIFRTQDGVSELSNDINNV